MLLATLAGHGISVDFQKKIIIYIFKIYINSVTSIIQLGVAFSGRVSYNLISVQHNFMAIYLICT